MKQDVPIEETIRARHSVRTYEERPLDARDEERINDRIATLGNPFSVDVTFRLVERGTTANGEKLGTYGMIKGAKDFIGATVVAGDLALESLGYSFESLVLYATSLGLGTCWLGGTFNRSDFSAAMGVRENELFPVISPIGYPVGKARMMDSLVRWVAKSDHRRAWSELFFKQDLTQPLTQDDAGEFAFPLEMLRLAPSAANKQPWRIVQVGGAYHFYEAKPMEDSRSGIDIQRVDMGIAACHFHLSALEKGLPGRFEKLPEPDVNASEQMRYVFSWVIG